MAQMRRPSEQNEEDMVVGTSPHDSEREDQYRQMQHMQGMSFDNV